MRLKSLLKFSSAIIGASMISSVVTINTASAELSKSGAPSSAANYGAFGMAASRPGPPAMLSPATLRNGLCTGTWTNVVANVTFQRSRNGYLAWGFKLTRVAIGKLGGVVEVTMPTATVNGHAINPPYRPHRVEHLQFPRQFLPVRSDRQQARIHASHGGQDPLLLGNIR